MAKAKENLLLHGTSEHMPPKPDAICSVRMGRPAVKLVAESLLTQMTLAHARAEQFQGGNCRQNRSGFGMKVGIVVASLAGIFSCAGAADIPHAKSEGTVPMEGVLLGTPANKDGPRLPSRDVSGIACRPTASGAKVCVVVSDENQDAQLVTFDGHKLVAGAQLPLLAQPDAADALGKIPDQSCSAGEKKFKELDAEAIAVSPDGVFYIAGSHGCGRNSKAFRRSAFLLTRVTPEADPKGQKNSYRLANVLAATSKLKTLFGKDLALDGLNVEGLAIVKDRLLVGLRAPVSATGTAYVVEVPLPGLFDPDPKSGLPSAVVHEINLGVGAGIRDLSPLPPDRLLILSGPADDAKVDVPFTIWTSSSSELDAATPLAILDDIPLATPDPKDPPTGPPKAKAEAIWLVGRGSGDLRLLVMFDSISNGGALFYNIPIGKNPV